MSFVKPYPINKENWKPLSYTEEKLLKRLESYKVEGKLKPVQDIFTVKQGIRTGNNKVFKLSESQFFLLPQNERNYFRPAVDNDSIKNGQLIKSNYVWYPYSIKGLRIESEDRLHELTSFYYEKYLKPNRDILIGRARKSEDNWWTLSEHRAWLTRDYSGLISTEFGKAGSFAYDEEGEFVVERGNGWIPKKKVENIDFYYFYLAVFSSPFFDTLLSIYSKQLAGGQWWDLGKKFTKNIPIPYLSNEIKEHPSYQKLVMIGKEISMRESYSFIIIDDYLSETFYPIFK